MQKHLSRLAVFTMNSMAPNRWAPRLQAFPPSLDATSSDDLSIAATPTFNCMVDQLRLHISQELQASFQHQFQSLSSFMHEQIVKIDSFIEEQKKNIESQIKHQSNRIDAFIKEQTAAIADLENRLNRLSPSNESIHQSHPPPLTFSHRPAPPTHVTYTPGQPFNDSAELIVSGIPADVPLSPDQIATRTLQALDASNLADDILSVDSFPRVRSGTTAQPSSTNPNFKNIVIRFKQTTTRDHVIWKRIQARMFTAAKVFSHQLQSPIFVKPLLLKATYELLRKTRKRCIELSFRLPVVINSVVYVRRNLQSPLIPILTDDDITKFICT